MNETWQRYLELATGVTRVTRDRAEAVVRSLVKQGEVAADRAERAVDELLSRSESNRSGLLEMVRAETERAVAALGLAPRSAVDELAAEVARLRERLGESGEVPPPPQAAAGTTEPAATAGTKKPGTARRSRSSSRGAAQRGSEASSVAAPSDQAARETAARTDPEARPSSEG